MPKGPVGGPRPFASTDECNLSFVFSFDDSLIRNEMDTVSSYVREVLESEGHVVTRQDLKIGKKDGENDSLLIVATVKDTVPVREAATAKKRVEGKYRRHLNTVYITTRDDPSPGDL